MTTGATARIGGAVSCEGEMLVELWWEPTAEGDAPTPQWILLPTNHAALITLQRWSEASARVAVRNGNGRYLFTTDQARVNLRAGTPTERAPTA